jgi:hypothetical protein
MESQPRKRMRGLDGDESIDLYEEYDLASPTIPDSQDDKRKRKQAMAAKIDGGNSPGGMLVSYGAATGSAPAVVGGLGLMALSAAEKKKQKQRELAAQMQMDRISRQQGAIRDMINVARGLRNL